MSPDTPAPTIPRSLDGHMARHQLSTYLRCLLDCFTCPQHSATLQKPPREPPKSVSRKNAGFIAVYALQGKLCAFMWGPQLCQNYAAHKRISTGTNWKRAAWCYEHTPGCRVHEVWLGVDLWKGSRDTACSHGLAAGLAAPSPQMTIFCPARSCSRLRRKPNLSFVFAEVGTVWMGVVRCGGEAEEAVRMGWGRGGERWWGRGCTSRQQVLLLHAPSQSNSLSLSTLASAI